MKELFTEVLRGVPAAAVWVAIASLIVHGLSVLLDLVERWRGRADRGSKCPALTGARPGT